MSPDPLALELRRLAVVVDNLAVDLAHMERRRLEADDRRVGIVLLPLAAELVGTAAFTGPGLYGIALNDRSAVGQAVREVMQEYGSLRALGKLLARLDGIVLAGFRLQPAGKAREGLAWRLVRVSDD